MASSEEDWKLKLRSLSKDHLLSMLMLVEKEDGNERIQKLMNKVSKPKRQYQRGRDIDFSTYCHRFIALRFSYMGEGYDGLARQNNTDETIEAYLNKALVETKLIENLEKCDYSRCGRTDKGVSAFGQVVSLRIRSTVKTEYILPSGKTVFDLCPGSKFIVTLPDGRSKEISELDYCSKLNSALPAEIRMIAWAPAPDHFDARFSTLFRTYRYFFLRGTLDLEKMQEAADAFVGLHDYRNFCRVDTNGVGKFIRRIYQFKVEVCPQSKDVDPANDMCQFEICGQSFLWHQVRCMVAILFLVGETMEKPSVVQTMLDIQNTTIKPAYTMADHLPLVLHDSAFENIDLSIDVYGMSKLYRSLKDQWQQMSIRTQLLRNQWESLLTFQVKVQHVMEHAPECGIQEAFPEKEWITWVQAMPYMAKRKFYSPLLSKSSLK